MFSINNLGFQYFSTPTPPISWKFTKRCHEWVSPRVPWTGRVDKDTDFNPRVKYAANIAASGKYLHVFPERQYASWQILHDGAMTWAHFSHYWLFVRANQVSPVGHHKYPAMRSFNVYFIVSLNTLLKKQCNDLGPPWRSRNLTAMNIELPEEKAWLHGKYKMIYFSCC